MKKRGSNIFSCIKCQYMKRRGKYILFLSSAFNCIVYIFTFLQVAWGLYLSIWIIIVCHEKIKLYFFILQNTFLILENVPNDNGFTFYTFYISLYLPQLWTHSPPSIWKQEWSWLVKVNEETEPEGVPHPVHEIHPTKFVCIQQVPRPGSKANVMLPIMIIMMRVIMVMVTIYDGVVFSVMRRYRTRVSD